MKKAYPNTSVTIENAIFCDEWGNNKVPVFHVKSPAALNQLIGYVKFLNGMNGTVLYRGQPHDHPHLSPSGCRKESAIPNELITAICNDGQLLKYFQLLDPEIVGWESYKSVVVEAALQHYGARTYCMDFVDNHWCALWFGVYEFTNGHYEKRTDYDDYMYLYMYLADTNGTYIRGLYIGEDSYTVDLRKALPSCFLRPAAQHGWIVRSKDRAHCTYDNNLVCVVKIKVEDAINWIGEGSLLLPDNFFPDYDTDSGYLVLLQRQMRSGLVLRTPTKEELLPPLTIANYHLHKSIFSTSLEKITSLKPMFRITSCCGEIKSIIDLYRALLLSGWSNETCTKSLKERWSSKNPCIGNSAITALLVQKYWGGTIRYFNISKWTHYFNVISNEIVDLTYQAIDQNCEKRYLSAEEISAIPQLYSRNKKEYNLLLRQCNIMNIK